MGKRACRAARTGWAPALAALEVLGVKNEPDPETGLWRLDWTAESWRERLDRLPIHPPALPRAEALHPAYALCRLLMMHPAPVERQPLEQVREIVKLAAGRTGAAPGRGARAHR